MAYVGRFAPSPTGELHLGSLVTAVASFLHARRAGGEWLIRIEDIDPPREVPGAADAILRSLEAFGLPHDRSVEYQSRRLERHLERARVLLGNGSAYYCSCSRQRIRKESGGRRYPGTCRDKGLQGGDAAIRLRAGPGTVGFEDRLRGPIERNIDALDGDFVIIRRDGLPAYHLAVVLDDAAQGVTDVVRGSDLITSTPLHVTLQQRLGLPTPEYWHIPLIADAGGEKLSKSAGAAALDSRNPAKDALRALRLLGLEVPRELAGAPPATLWDWAQVHWRIERLAAGPDPIRLDRLSPTGS